MQIRDDVCSALDHMIRICTATTPPVDVPHDEVGTIKLAAADEERMWQKASIDDLDGKIRINLVLDQALPDTLQDHDGSGNGGKGGNMKKEILLARVLLKVKKIH